MTSINYFVQYYIQLYYSKNEHFLLLCLKKVVVVVYVLSITCLTAIQDHMTCEL
jgi:hypothetical protein